MITIPAYAKINPYLNITSRRKDGYHEIESYMQTVSLCDNISLELSDKDITVSGSVAVSPEKDLTYRAALAFFEFTLTGGGVNISIDKKIPVQAGLGGGSADAAAVLRGLNKLKGTCLSPEQLAIIGEAVGSDVPFCVMGGSRIVRGRGEIISDAPAFPDCAVVIVEGRRGADTPGQFRALDAKFGDFSEKRGGSIEDFISAAASGSLEKTAGAVYNIFDSTDAYDGEIVNKLKKEGALAAALSGSGSAVFGLFGTKGNADRAALALSLAGYNAFSCLPVRKGDL